MSSTERQLKMKEQLQRVKSILRSAWDPIGVGGERNAQDEYDAYAARLLKLALQDDESGLQDYLGTVEAEEMGLPANPQRNKAVAAALLATVKPGKERE